MIYNYFSKKIFYLAAILFCLFQINGMAQLVNNGTTITVTSGGILYAAMDITNATNGAITNEGKIFSTGNLVNVNTASLSGNGIYSVQGNFTNTGIYNQDNFLLEFFGDNNSKLKNKTGVIYNLQVNKNSNKNVILQGKEKILNSITFLQDKNWIKLGKNVLTLANNCTILNYSKDRFIITNGAGSLKKLNIGNSPFTFPVGYTNKTYNPLVITEAGTADDYSVQALEHALLQGSTGNPISSGGIDVAWFIEEAVAGGGNAIIEASWKNTDELPNFDYTKCMVVRYNGTRWDYKAAQAGVATGTNYRSIGRSGFSAFGDFTVLSVNNPSFTGNAFSVDNKTAAVNANSEAVIKVYPTLVQQNHITVDVLGGLKNIQKMSINITDVNGKIVYQKQDTDFQQQQVTLPNLAQGIYFVNILYDTKKFVQKIIVSR